MMRTNYIEVRKNPIEDIVKECISKIREKYKEEIEDNRKITPILVEIWKRRGHEILTKDKWEYWDLIVQTRLKNTHRGDALLSQCLDVIKILNNGGSLKSAKEEIKNQKHTELSLRLVFSIVVSLCDRSEDFVEYLKQKN